MASVCSQSPSFRNQNVSSELTQPNGRFWGGAAGWGRDYFSPEEIPTATEGYKSMKVYYPSFIR